jgi:hypothetical protein
MAERGKHDVTRDMLDDWAGSTRAALAPFLKREREILEAGQQRKDVAASAPAEGLRQAQQQG